jgi:hypothetical protein
VLHSLRSSVEKTRRQCDVDGLLGKRICKIAADVGAAAARKSVALPKDTTEVSAAAPAGFQSNEEHHHMTTTRIF